LRSLLIFLAVLCACGAQESFTVHSTNPLDIRYFLTGPGGYGGFLNKRDPDGAYRVPLQYEGRSAKTLKAILYSPGCQFDTLSVDLLSDRTRIATYICRQLPMISLRGKITPPPAREGPLDVRIDYMASWCHPFFGIADGAIQQFSLGRATLSSAGQFEIQIPDFSQDKITSEKPGGYLDVAVLGNSLERVTPSADFAFASMFGLKILPAYDSEIAFHPRQ
jgi:hypothetical protein